jgi:hypothetical protein
MLKFRCRECDQKIGVPEEWAGKKVRCPRCANAVPVPQVLEAVVRPGPVSGSAVKPVAKAAPKSPLMPMPPVRGKTVAVPHPAVKGKGVAKAPGAAPAKPGVAKSPAVKAPVSNEADAGPARRRRAKAPEPVGPVVPPVVKAEPEVVVRPPEEEPVQTKHEEVKPPEAEVQFKGAEEGEPKEGVAEGRVEAAPEVRAEETPKSEGSAEAEASAEGERPPEVEPAGPTPEPVMVSAKRTTGEPIVMEAPKTADYSSLFADNVVSGVKAAGVDLQVDEPAPVEGATGAVSVEAGEAVEAREGLVSGPPLSEVMDALRGPEESGVTSSAAVSDIVKGLTKGEVEEEVAPPPVRTACRRLPDEFRPVPESRPTAQFPPSPTAARALGVAAMLVGVGALALCVTPRWTRLALPVGALGLVVALMGAVAPARRRGTEVALAMGSAAVSLAGILLAVLVATGVVPLAGAGGQLRGGPSARLGDVEVKVASAEVVRPVLYSAGGKVPKTDGQRVLRVDLEVRNLSGSGNVAYKSWGALRADVEPVILQDDEGNQLKLIDPAPKVPPGRPREFPTVIAGKSRGVCDVLLFEAPPADSHELDLQLPGSNVQARGAFSLHIPASMLRK